MEKAKWIRNHQSGEREKIRDFSHRGYGESVLGSYLCLFSNKKLHIKPTGNKQMDKMRTNSFGQMMDK